MTYPGRDLWVRDEVVDLPEADQDVLGCVAPRKPLVRGRLIDRGRVVDRRVS
jgi:hypothetical protein